MARKNELGDNQGKVLLALPNQVYTALKAYAEANKTPMSKIVRELITNHLNAQK